MTEETKKLKELIEAAGYETQSYSGRAMFGDRCLAFTVDQGTSPFRAFADILDETASGLEETEVLSKALRDTRTDSLGLGSIIYFPRFEYAEEYDEEGEDDGNE